MKPSLHSDGTEPNGHPRPSASRLVASAYGWIVLGAVYCAMSSWGVFSLWFFFYSIPVGAVLGAVVAVPNAILLASWIDRRANPPRSASQFVLTLEVVGIIGGLAGCIVFAWWPIYLQPSILLTPTAVANALLALTGVCIAGRGVGRRLARSHLRACGMAFPPSRISQTMDALPSPSPEVHTANDKDIVTRISHARVPATFVER